jgi:hypothetical protein
MDYSSARNHGCRITEYKHRGLTILTMENDLLKISILVDRGSDIIELAYKPLDLDFMWKAPGGIRPAGSFIPTSASSLGNYLDYLSGGWQEILPGGGPFLAYGAEIGLHGEVCLLPWSFSIEEDTAEKVSLRLNCKTVRFPFRLTKIITLQRGSTVVNLEEKLINESDESIEFLWSHHPAYGKPFLDGNCRIDVPAKTFHTSSFYNSPTALFNPEHQGKWPLDKDKNEILVDLSLVPPLSEPVSDLYYLKDLAEGWYAITNIDKQIGIGFSWDLSVFPYLTYWQVCNGSYGYPWYGRTYNIGLELWNSFTDKLETARKNQTLQSIAGGQTISTEIKVIIYSDLEKVNRILPNGEVL